MYYNLDIDLITSVYQQSLIQTEPLFSKQSIAWAKTQPCDLKITQPTTRAAEKGKFEIYKKYFYSRQSKSLRGFGQSTQKVTS